MKRTMLTLLIVGLFAGVGTCATAKGTAAGEQATVAVSANPQPPARNAGRTNPSGNEVALESSSKADYKTARNKAQADYMDAKARCVSMGGDAMRACIKSARMARNEALAEAKMQWGSQAGMNGTDGGAAHRPGADRHAKGPAKSAMDDADKTSAQSKHSPQQ